MRQLRLAGFTLVELMITLAVLAVLMAMAAPSFREMSLNNRGSGIINSLLADVAVARSEAVKTARPAFVTATGGSWNNGSRQDIPRPRTSSSQAVSHVRNQRAPVLLRLTVPRLEGHSAQDTQAYKSEEEIAAE